MSESSKITLKKRPKHLKGKYSMSKPNHLISFNIENIFNSQNLEKSNKINTPTNTKKELKMSVNKLNKKLNNKSFVLRSKNRKEIREKMDKVSSKKIIYKNQKSFINVKKTIKNKDNEINIDKKGKKSFHSRINSFQVEFKDKFFLNNISKTERNSNYDNTLIKRNKNITKKNDVVNCLENNQNEYTINKNLYLNKTNNIIEDNEESSTKNTKLVEQKLSIIDNIHPDEKYLIISNRNINKKEKSKENQKNKPKYKKLINITHKNKRFNNSFLIKNRAFSPTMRNKFNIIKKNIFENNDQGKTIISPLNKNNNKHKRDISKTNPKKENNFDSKKKVCYLIQRVKEKLESFHDVKSDNKIKNEFQNNSNLSFIKERKTMSNGNNPFQIKKNIHNKNNYKQKKKNKILNKPKSPITFRSQNNLLCELNKNQRDNNSSIIQIKDNKNNFIKKNKYHNSFIKKGKLIKNYNKGLKYNNNDIDDNKFHDNQKLCFNSKSQNDVFSEFIIKSLNEEDEEKIKNNKNNNISPKEKGPKDLEEKKIEKIENLCQKGFSGPGVKKINQDNFFIYNNFMDNPNYMYLGVCDGHGTFGHNVSGYLVYNLPLTLNDILIKGKIDKITEKNIDEINSIIENTFIKIDKDITLDTRIDSLFSGSTCVSLVFTPSKLICANLGDSRCVLGKYDGKNWFSKDISYDHKPDNPLEKERIIQNGGRIESYKDEGGNYMGPKRVWLKNEDVPGLAMSRSFGDGVAHSVGVISKPEIINYSLLHEDKFAILASDGIWEFITSDECVNFVKDFYVKKDINGALNFLYKEASKRWIIEEEVIDDITLILIFFK